MNFRQPAAFAFALALLALAAPPAPAAPAAGGVGAEEGLTRLREGNARFAEGRPKAPNRTVERRRALAEGQKPFAVVVACSDSRVAPELLFDQGLGDLFVVRTAGHVVDPVALGSIEFAVGKLGARSIMVVGHERCGAVQAALEHATVPGSIGKVLEAIQPAVGGPEKATPEGLDQAARRNVAATVKQLETASPVLTPMVKDGSVRVSGGVYDLDSGVVAPVPGGAAR